MFLAFARRRHLAIDKVLHDGLVAEGQACIDRNDLEGTSPDHRTDPRKSNTDQRQTGCQRSSRRSDEVA